MQVSTEAFTCGSENNIFLLRFVDVDSAFCKPSDLWVGKEYKFECSEREELDFQRKKEEITQKASEITGHFNHRLRQLNRRGN